MTCFETEASSSMCGTRTWLKSRLHLVQMRDHSRPNISALDHQRANKNRSPTRHASKSLRRIGQWSHSHPDGFLRTTTQKSPDLRYVKCSHKKMFHSTVDNYNFISKQRVWWWWRWCELRKKILESGSRPRSKWTNQEVQIYLGIESRPLRWMGATLYPAELTEPTEKCKVE